VAEQGQGSDICGNSGGILHGGGNVCAVAMYGHKSLGNGVWRKRDACLCRTGAGLWCASTGPWEEVRWMAVVRSLFQCAAWDMTPIGAAHDGDTGDRRRAIGLPGPHSSTLRLRAAFCDRSTAAYLRLGEIHVTDRGGQYVSSLAPRCQHEIGRPVVGIKLRGHRRLGSAGGLRAGSTRSRPAARGWPPWARPGSSA